eukprot:scaffold131284_cov19-Tisochrysis_lutea.AAC.1
MQRSAMTSGVAWYCRPGEEPWRKGEGQHLPGPGNWEASFGSGCVTLTCLKSYQDPACRNDHFQKGCKDWVAAEALGSSHMDFDLMRPDSSMDTCALLGFLKRKEVGGLLSQKPAKKMGPTRK